MICIGWQPDYRYASEIQTGMHYQFALIMFCSVGIDSYTCKCHQSHMMLPNTVFGPVTFVHIFGQQTNFGILHLHRCVPFQFPNRS